MNPGEDGPERARSDRPGERATAIADELRAPWAAAVAGIAFALILGTAVILLHLALPGSGDQSEWITEESRRHQVGLALALIPYAGIAFLWFIGVIRSRLGAREDKLFATAFLGSGLLFVAMLFVAAASIGALISVYDGPNAVSENEVRLASATGTVLLATYGIRMAAVFTLVVTNLGRCTGIIPRWLWIFGYAAAAVLFLAPARTVWAVLLFPAWVFLLSVEILIASRRTPAVADRTSE